MISRFFKIAFYVSLLLLICIGCRSYNVRQNMTPEERFALAKKMFDNRDFLDAKTQFRILTLNNPGIEFIDEAQYMLAESHFGMKEYILAADEYGRLLRLYPQSQWLDDAQYKVGLSYYKLSPKPSLDQKYTKQAIISFQRFIEDYPQSDLIPEVEEVLKTCRRKLSEKEFKAGVLYRKMNDCEAANVYFSSVIENYYDTRFITSALFWKGECLYELERHDEAQETFTELVTKYPTSDFVEEAKERLRDLQAASIRIEEANGTSSIKEQN